VPKNFCPKEPIAKLPMRTAPMGGQSAMRDFFAHHAWTGADSITFSWLSLFLWQTTPPGLLVMTLSGRIGG
jgi:hypothetical protein